MTEIVKVSAGGNYEKMYSYSRIVQIGKWIFTANSAALNPETGEFSKDPVEQAKQILDNFEHALASVGSDLSDTVNMTVHIPDRKNIFIIMEHIGERFRGIDPTRTMVCTPLGSDDYLLEISLICYKGAGKMDQERRKTGLFAKLYPD